MKENKATSLSVRSLILIVVSLCLFYLLKTTWLKWGNIIIDTSREYWVPLQLLNGKVLYKDIFYNYGPLAPYILAGYYSLFGIKTFTLALCGITTLIFMLLGIYKTARIFLEEISSTITTLSFLFVCAFGFYCTSGIFNFIIPYSFASIFFSTLTIWSSYYFLKFILDKKYSDLIRWCLILYTTFICRFDLTTPVWIAFLISGMLLVAKTKINKPLITITLFIPAIAAFFSYYVFLYATSSFEGFNESIITAIKQNIGDPHSIYWSGINNISLNILAAAISLLIQVSVVFVLLYLIKRLKDSTSNISETFLASLTILASVTAYLCTKNILSTDMQFRSIIIILAGNILIAIISILKNKSIPENIASLGLSAVALACVSRIFLAITPHQYGFYLMPAALIAYYIFYLKTIPLLFQRLSGSSSIEPQPAITTFFVLLTLQAWSMSSNLYNTKNIQFETSRGIIMESANIEAALVAQLLIDIDKNTAPTDSLLVMPEGVSVNFFTKRNNPTKYYTFLPPDIRTVGEEKIINAIDSAKVKYIAVIYRNTLEYGFGQFGTGYALKIADWIKNHYEPLKQYGAGPFDPQYPGAIIYKLKGSD